MKQLKIIFIIILVFFNLSMATEVERKGKGDDKSDISIVDDNVNALSHLNKIRLQVPFRITEGIYQYKPLSKNQVKLSINGQPRKIIALHEQEKSIAHKPELGRSFILSFHIGEYNKTVTDTVSYFVTDVLNYSDMLFVLTPLNVFRIDVSRNKLKMIEDIETLVKKECENYNRKRLQVERTLEGELNKLRWQLQNPYRAPGPFIAVLQFFSTYPRQFKNFNNRFWLPDIGKYRQIIDFLGFREGERWCIHFQQRDVYSLYYETKRLLTELTPYFTRVGEMSNALKSNFHTFERELSRMAGYSGQPLLNPILDANINYNAILFGRLALTDPQMTRGETFFLEKIIKQTSEKTGGITVETTNTLAGMNEIVHHKDHYYELLFNFNGDIEEKKLKVTIDGSKTKPGFREKFKLEEVENLIHYLSKEKVKIDRVSTKTNKDEKGITFAIKSFELREFLQKTSGDKFGILLVRLRLLNEWGERVYISERMLRVTEKRVSISHMFPKKYQGQFILDIFVTDLIRNSSVSFTRDIAL